MGRNRKVRAKRAFIHHNADLHLAHGRRTDRHLEQSGTIPTMVYYGIHLLRPAYFYVAALAICSTVSLGIGGSWTTVGTIGVGLMGLATMVGVSPAITAGASFSRRHHGRPSAAASGVGRCQEFNGSWLASLRQRHLVGEAKGYHVHTGVTEIDRLLSRGSMASMLETLWIIIGAVTVWHSARRIQTALKTHQSAP